MIKRAFYSILCVGLMAPLAASAQCENTHNYCEKGEDPGWQVTTQSKSGALVKGEEYDFSFVVYEDIDYRVALCTDDDELQGKIEFEIYEMVTEKRYDERKKRDAYMKVPNYLIRNTEHEMIQEVEFNSTKSRKLYMKVFVPETGTDGGGKRRNRLGGADYVCVGVLIQHQKAVETGFE